jgi:hypothetical protein
MSGSTQLQPSSLSRQSSCESLNSDALAKERYKSNVSDFQKMQKAKDELIKPNPHSNWKSFRVINSKEAALHHLSYAVNPDTANSDQLKYANRAFSHYRKYLGARYKRASDSRLNRTLKSTGHISTLAAQTALATAHITLQRPELNLGYGSALGGLGNTISFLSGLYGKGSLPYEESGNQTPLELKYSQKMQYDLSKLGINLT